MNFNKLQRGGQVWGLVALTALVAACGDSAASGDGDEGGEDAGLFLDPETDGGAKPDEDTDAAVKGDAGPVTERAECESGEQDNDADGVCSEACSEAVECGMGSCVDSTGSTLCLCDAHFAGEACDECAPEYTGGDCASCAAEHVASTLREGDCVPDGCMDVECGNKGSCAMVDDAALCVCDQGFAGDTCNVCAAGYTGANCDTCDTGYSPDGGGACIPDVCVGKDCGHGTCAFEPPATAVCECETGWDAASDCMSCALGYLSKNGACVLELPVQTGNLTLHLNMSDAGSYLKTMAGEVLLWQSDTAAVGVRSAVYEGDIASAPKEVKVSGLTLLKFDGAQHLRLNDVSMTADSYWVFIAMDPDSTGGATMAPLAAVPTDAPTQHGFLLRTQKNGTEVRYLHRAPFGGSGGDDLVSGTVTDPGVLDPFMVVTAERSRIDGNIVQKLRVDGAEQFSSTSNPAFGSIDDMDLFIGQQSSGGSYPFKGRIGEIIVYNGALTDAQRAEVEAYLKLKWVPKKKLVLSL